jgi:cobalt-zinc-cadmium efflux system membrane fusion protein
LVGVSSLPCIGDWLNKGQFIADVEQQFVASEKLQFAVTSIQLESEIQQAQQEVDLRGKELNRAQQLYSEGAAPLKQLQSAETALNQAEAKLAGARRSKEKYDAAQSSANSEPRRASIVSPISGTVVAANATLGQQVDPAKSLFTIADLSRVWVEAAVHERDLARVRGVREAEIEIPGERPFIGRLVTIGNLVDPLNRTVPVIFSVENRHTDLKIEMFVEAHIPTGPPAKVLVIPTSAVLSEEGSYSVYVETGPGVFRRKAVKLGQRKDTRVVVTSGLEKGEKVVTVGAAALRSESLKGEIPVEMEEKEKAEKKP